MRMLVDLALPPEHRRSHGALYSGLSQGRINVDRLRHTRLYGKATAQA
ncbi:hypothetical protein [Streptomyces olivochromogenes]